MHWADPPGFEDLPTPPAAPSGKMLLVAPDGTQFEYFDFDPSRPVGQRGQLSQVTSPDGTVTTYSDFTTDGKPTVVSRVDGDLGERFVYDYLSSGANSGRVASITQERTTSGGTNWDTVRSVEYAYYVGVEDFGTLGDLKSATLKDAAGQTIDTSYYRYYTDSLSGGYAGGLKYVVGPAAFERLSEAVTNPYTALDSEIADFADHYFEYDSDHRVVTEVAAGAGCSACAGGLGEYTYTYTTSTNDLGFNSWQTKTVETRPDGSVRTVYTNPVGQVLLSVEKLESSGPEWVTYYQYDDAGRLILMAEPSAVTGYNDSYADLVHYVSGNAQYLADGTGLITTYESYTATTATATTAGGAAGYLRSVAVRQGELGQDIPQSLLTYIERTGGGSTVYVIAAETVYSGIGSVGAETTTYEYTWHAGTTQASSVTTTLPTVLTTSNGSGSATSFDVVYDAQGRPIWTRDAGGFLAYTEYDLGTGAVIKQISDVDTTQTSDFADLPSGWSTPTGGGAHRITRAEVDDQGRVTKLTRPDGSIDYTVYDDANQEVRFYAGWDTGVPTGPTVVVREDRANGYSETLTMTATPAVDGTGRPTGAEAISGVLSLSRSHVNEAGQVVHQDDYFDLTGLTYTTAAALGTNFLRTQFGYDQQGRPNRTETPDGVIYRSVHDGMGRLVSEWIGDNDTPTSGYWSPANPADMQLVREYEYEYDGGGVGDGNLTLLTEYPGGGADPRVTQSWYDWRNRPVVIKEGVATSPVKVAVRALSCMPD
ncbi:MAG: hypothetical protein LC104_21105 [Bacteroidales bacterium]|nr:hypothetical protein [Bacteroidales bacterium]